MRLMFLLSLIVLGGCAELNSPGYDDRGGYDYRRDDYRYDQRYDHRRNDYYYGDGSYYDRQREHDRERRQELKRESRELESERRRLEAEREALERQRQEEARRAQAQEWHNQRQRAERCPAGFRPSEDKCTPRERQRGCRDMRLPGGLGCVSR